MKKLNKRNSCDIEIFGNPTKPCPSCNFTCRCSTGAVDASTKINNNDALNDSNFNITNGLESTVLLG